MMSYFRDFHRIPLRFLVILESFIAFGFLGSRSLRLEHRNSSFLLTIIFVKLKHERVEVI